MDGIKDVSNLAYPMLIEELAQREGIGELASLICKYFPLEELDIAKNFTPNSADIIALRQKKKYGELASQLLRFAGHWVYISDKNLSVASVFDENFRRSIVSRLLEICNNHKMRHIPLLYSSPPDATELKTHYKNIVSRIPSDQRPQYFNIEELLILAENSREVFDVLSRAVTCSQSSAPR